MKIIADNEVSIDGYDIVRRDRLLINGTNGGGVCFYIRSNINFTVRTDLVFDQLESLSIEINKPRSKSFIAATWYRPPNSSFELFSDFESLVGKLDAEGKEYYLILYFRIPHNTLCLAPKFCINHCFQMLLGICSVPKSI